MKHLLFLFLLALAACQHAPEANFVSVRDGHFYRGDTPYRLVGANFWCAATLASEGQGGNRERLDRELDHMHQLGITNIRVLVGGEGPALPDYQVKPSLQPTPGEYNDTLLLGLDYLLTALERRDMTCVLYLNNSWEWSGGYGQYLAWAGAGPVPSPKDWEAFLRYHCQFVRNDSARALAAAHTRHIVGRTNTLSGRAYTAEPAIMAWEVANEPRAFAPDSLTKRAFASWVEEQASLIKSMDKNHLVTTGSEGLYGCEEDMDLFRQIHALPTIDYATIHIWPYNWNWVGRRGTSLANSAEINDTALVRTRVGDACQRTREYVAQHLPVVRALRKPLVLEEFGYPRDGYAISPQSSTTGRDRYYRFAFSLMADGTLDGVCFWAWGGDAPRRHTRWRPGDDLTGDPAQEEQGMNAVFATDLSTLRVIEEAGKK